MQTLNTTPQGIENSIAEINKSILGYTAEVINGSDQKEWIKRQIQVLEGQRDLLEDQLKLVKALEA